MAKIRWSNIGGQQVSQLLLGDMYQFEYETTLADKYFDAFPLIFILRRNKVSSQGEKYFEGINFHYYDLPRRISLFRTLSRFFTNKVITDEEEDDDELDRVINKITDTRTSSKTLAARIESLRDDREKDELARAMENIPDDTFLRAREFRTICMISRKYRAAKVAYRRYNYDKILSKIVRVPPKKWYEAVVERSQRFFTKDLGKIKGQRVWQETLIKLRRS